MSNVLSALRFATTIVGGLFLLNVVLVLLSASYPDKLDKILQMSPKYVLIWCLLFAGFLLLISLSRAPKQK